MQLRSKYDQVFRYLLCAVDIFSKYVWAFSVEDKKVL